MNTWFATETPLSLFKECGMTVLADDVAAIPGARGEVDHVDKIILLPPQMRIGELVVEDLAKEPERGHRGYVWFAGGVRPSLTSAQE